MRIRDLQLEPVQTAQPGESIAGAADRMRFYEVGSLAVVEQREFLAIITERDLIRALADRADPDRTTVRFYMTPEPVTISIDADVTEAGALMLTLGVRHLPVMDGTRLVGMASIRDVLGAQLGARQAQAGARL